ncbi:hypothetical protein T03_4050 [Trichinella britovi]|uniref:Uncharacterized protein n=1 Tax=Trichinella britovi TaxID=45882 RepID=A0A0V1CTG3_TRIBR|nr:hypothetical protein T03_4050 [Trichinella britovi]
MQPIYQLNVEQTLKKLQKSNKKLQLASLSNYSRSTTQEIDSVYIEMNWSLTAVWLQRYSFT